MATLSSILAWEIPWTEESGRLQSMELQRVRHNWANFTHTHFSRLRKKIEKEKYLKPESKLKNINLDEGEKKLNWQDLRSKQNIKEDLAEEKEEDKWKKLDKILEDI